MASRADLTAHRHERNPQGCVVLLLSMRQARCSFLCRHQGVKSAFAAGTSAELYYFSMASICFTDIKYGGIYVHICVLCKVGKKLFFVYG